MKNALDLDYKIIMNREYAPEIVLIRKDYIYNAASQLRIAREYRERELVRFIGVLIDSGIINNGSEADNKSEYIRGLRAQIAEITKTIDNLNKFTVQ